MPAEAENRSPSIGIVGHVGPERPVTFKRKQRSTSSGIRTHVIGKLQLRYREPYNARHTYASWMLMIGKNIAWIAEQLGNSIEVMSERYGRWIKGAKESEVAKIQEAMRAQPTAQRLSTLEDLQIPSDALQADPSNARIAISEGWGRLSWRKVKQKRLEALAPSRQK